MSILDDSLHPAQDHWKVHRSIWAGETAIFGPSTSSVLVNLVLIVCPLTSPSPELSLHFVTFFTTGFVPVLGAI